MPYVKAEDKNRCQRRWYANNRERHLAWVRARKVGIRVWFAEFKRTLSCIRCGEDHSACIDFHHRDESSKTDDVCTMVRDGRSIAQILREIEKCDVLCANCHRRLHSDE